MLINKGIIEQRAFYSRPPLKTATMNMERFFMKIIKATEITSKEIRCGIGACPAIFRTNRKTVMVIGSVPAVNEIPRNVRNKMGKGEMVVEIPLDSLPKK